MDKEEFIEDFMEELKEENKNKDFDIKYEINYSDSGNIEATFSEKVWGAVQSKLDDPDRNTELEEDEDCSSVSYELSNLQYLSDYFIVNLMADFQANEYKLVIKDR